MKPLIIVGMLIVVSTISAGAADEKPATTPPQPAAAKEAYAPGLGEIMTLMQMRHSKLWFAGKAKNWQLADYELDELKEGFDDAAKLFPVFKDGVPIAQMISDISATTLAELRSAIDARDRAKFNAAFDKLTADCNACHRSANHDFIVIRRPTTSPFSNQTFSVKSK